MERLSIKHCTAIGEVAEESLHSAWERRTWGAGSDESSGDDGGKAPRVTSVRRVSQPSQRHIQDEMNGDVPEGMQLKGSWSRSAISNACRGMKLGKMIDLTVTPKRNAFYFDVVRTFFPARCVRKLLQLPLREEKNEDLSGGARLSNPLVSVRSGRAVRGEPTGVTSGKRFSELDRVVRWKRYFPD